MRSLSVALAAGSLIGLSLLCTIVACQQQEVISDRLERQVDRDLRYVDVKENPEGHRGKLVLAGGMILSAQRLNEGTRIEVLQMPLSEEMIPDDRSEFTGRFVVVDFDNQHLLDPALLEDGRMVTLVGEVLGATKTHGDELQKQVPELALKHIAVWGRHRLRDILSLDSGYFPPSA